MQVRGGLYTREECRQLARRIIEAYDGNKDGKVDTLEMRKMLVDCYRGMKTSISPSAEDNASFVHVLDRQGTGKVSYEDMEAYILARFCLE
jgi:Ca2+-binding EF-hand superfamily protein